MTLNVALAFTPPVAFAQSVVSQVVGQVADVVTTSRDVQINTFVEQALFSDPSKPLRLELKLTDPQFDREVTRVLMEIVVAKEAKNFNSAPVPEDDINKSMIVVRQLAAREPALQVWNRLAVSNGELRDVILQKLTAKKFIQFKSRASAVPVTDAEALQYFQKNRSRFGQAPFSQFKESIKAFLSQEQSSARIRDWFELLQRKYRVKRLGGKSPQIPANGS